jgi:hypothetical protein
MQAAKAAKLDDRGALFLQKPPGLIMDLTVNDATDSLRH